MIFTTFHYTAKFTIIQATSPLVRQHTLPWRRQTIQMRQKILAAVEICTSKLLLSSSMQPHCSWETAGRLQACLPVSLKKPSCVKATLSVSLYAFVSHFLLYALVHTSKQHGPASPIVYCIAHLLIQGFKPKK